MTRGSAHGLTTPAATNWRNNAACHDEDPETFFPLGNGTVAKAQERHAKVICSSCPSIRPCAQWALNNRIGFGVWGGLSESERRTLLRKRGVRLTADPDAPEPKPRQPRPATIPDAWKHYTKPMPPGHVAWTGPRSLPIGGREYSPNQIAYIHDRGHEPNGVVLRTCDTAGCVLPLHLADNEERMRCGTRGGYRKHLREKTEICGACRQANTDADNLLRRTGTTRAGV